MKTVVILHGITGHAGITWQQWLHDQLVTKGYTVIMPDLPSTDHPDRNEWLETVKELTKDIDYRDLIFVGHSLGVATALDYIEQTKKKYVPLLISVSGFGDDYGMELNSYFMAEKSLDFKKIREVLKRVYVIYGDNDPYVPQETLRKLATDLAVEPRIISGGGHLNAESMYAKEFQLVFDLITDTIQPYDIYKAGGILVKDRKVLVERSKGKTIFSTPGGKVDIGENVEDALVRELKEEMGIVVHKEDVEKFGSYIAKAAGQEHRIVCMEVFHVKKWEGEITPLNEVEEVQWVSMSDLKKIDVGSIIAHKIMPALQKQGIID